MAALPVDAVKVTFGGEIDGVQGWSCSTWLAQGTTGTAMTSAQLGTHLTSISADIEGLWTGTVQAMNVPAVTFTGARAGFYLAGALVESAAAELIATTTAGSGGPPLPASASLVGTLTTGIPSRSTRGRVYIPATGIVVTATLYATTSQAANAAAGLAAYLTGINAHWGFGSGAGPKGVVVASWTHGLVTPVQQVQFDTKIDSQRRREDKLRGAVSTAVVTPA